LFFEGLADAAQSAYRIALPMTNFEPAPSSENTPDLSRERLPRAFDLGQMVATPGALDALEKASVEPLSLLLRHQSCDWGDLGAEDKRANDNALKFGGRIFSAYTLPTNERVWIITESDHSVTTILLPSEY